MRPIYLRILDRFVLIDENQTRQIVHDTSTGRNFGHVDQQSDGSFRATYISNRGRLGGIGDFACENTAALALVCRYRQRGFPDFKGELKFPPKAIFPTGDVEFCGGIKREEWLKGAWAEKDTPSPATKVVTFSGDQNYLKTTEGGETRYEPVEVDEDEIDKVAGRGID